MFTKIRSNTNQMEKVNLNVNDKWTFHRVGIMGPNSIKNENKIGWLTTFDNI